jgi:hypothetical protein
MLLEKWDPAGPTTGTFHPIDAAQACVFGAAMRAEITELEELIAVAKFRWANRLDAGWGSSRTPEPVLRLREKRAETQRILDGLLARFAID